VSYTAIAVAGVAVTVVLDVAVLRTRLLARRVFWTAYAIVLAFQLLTNGWLTGRGIVTYDEDAILGARLVHAPVEDLLFGFALVVQTLAWWVWWGRRLSDVPDAHAREPGRPRAPGSAPAP
jgi:lycopene cyclase domain-containing protein